ncbi:phosphodiesterase [Corallincola spongiicola]|uniref:Phosphoesterase n=1 Tax=Corallincola spongiicola TaxID=2520508 RepID=A0ABY1WU94_9GAMM|nr:phosphodiesterase [Corallincola spongiicola]TAA48324.1 phosphodiesterase [Corallincola spongiicola]
MKLLIASDIHGCAHATKQLLKHFVDGKFDYLVLLGDLLNHGPRNPLPLGYDPQTTAALLNQYADRIIAVRGNCDSEVDQALLAFPITADYNHLLLDGRRWFLSHGHLYSPDKMPALSDNDLFCYGHFHVPKIDLQPSHRIFNPGSITMPREGHPATFGCYADKTLKIIRLDDGEIIEQHALN